MHMALLYLLVSAYRSWKTPIHIYLSLQHFFHWSRTARGGYTCKGRLIVFFPSLYKGGFYSNITPELRPRFYVWIRADDYFWTKTKLFFGSLEQQNRRMVGTMFFFCPKRSPKWRIWVQVRPRNAYHVGFVFKRWTHAGCCTPTGTPHLGYIVPTTQVFFKSENIIYDYLSATRKLLCLWHLFCSHATCSQTQ